MIEDSTVIQHKQKLLEQHRRNLSYLEQQAAQCGVFVPLEIHNALTVERDAIALLERELVSQGISPRPQASWQALIIDTDSHWRDIVANNIEQLGGAVLESQKLSPAEQGQVVTRCHLAIVGVSRQTQAEPAAQSWVQALVGPELNLPVILLASWDNRDLAIALRNTMRQGNMNITVTTIFKETFDLYWFARIVHQILTR